MLRVPKGVVIVAADGRIERLAEAVEYKAAIDAVRAAIAAKWLVNLAPGAERPYVYLHALYADMAIVERDGKFWAYPYALGDDGVVTLQDAKPAVQKWETAAVKEAVIMAAGGAVLTEAKKAADGTPSGRFEVIAIRAGTSKNGNHYTDAALREAVPLFEQVRVFVKSDAEHTGGGGKDFNKLIGQLAEPRFVEGAGVDSGEIRATLELIEPAGAIGTKLTEAYGRGMSHLFGLSIDATAKTATVVREGKKVRMATKFVKVASVDLIVEPGAGGGLVRMVEAADDSDDSPQEQDDMKLRERLFEAIKKHAPAKAQTIDIDKISDEELEAAYREAVAQPAAANTAPPAASGNQVDVEQRISEAVAVANARAYGRSALASAKLPAKTVERLQSQFAADARLTEAAVDDAIKGAREELAAVTESGRVNMPGFDVQVGDRKKAMAEMLDAFFDPKHKDHRSVTSFKECYIEITGDKRVTGRLAECDRSRLAESLGVMREAIDSTTFADALGDSITRRMQQVYTGETDLQAWRKVARSTPVNDFRTQERVRIGGYGNLPAVNQGADYTALTSPGDDKATYAVTKRGGLETLTIEAIKNDDIGAIRQIPVELALAAANTLYEFVFDFYRTNPTIYDTLALYVAGHNNLFTAALDATTFAAHRVAMAKQTRAGSTKRLGLTPRTILVTWELQETAFNLFVRNQNNDKTFVQSINPEIIVPAYWTDANDWVTVADPMKQAVIEVGFLDGREEPELFVQDMPNVGSLFSSDKITWKIRHIYSGAVLVDGFKATTKAVVP